MTSCTFGNQCFNVVMHASFCTYTTCTIALPEYRIHRIEAEQNSITLEVIMSTHYVPKLFEKTLIYKILKLLFWRLVYKT